MGKWSELPVDLLAELEKHLGSNAIQDRLGICSVKIRLRAVCTSWRTYLPKMPTYQETQVPWLFLPLDNTKNASHGLFNTGENKVYEFDLPEAQGKLFKGSSQGWDATVEDTSTSPDIYLLNPFTKSRIKLPPRNKFPDIVNYRSDKINKEFGVLMTHRYGKGVHFYKSNYVNTNLVDKIVLSSSPSKYDCLVIAIYNLGNLAYCRCTDKKWIPLPGKSYIDVVFHKGKLHALRSNGTITVFENICSNVNVTEIARPPFRMDANHLYLVESTGGDLMMVDRICRHTNKEGYELSHWVVKTLGFRVYKHDNENCSWSLLTDLGEDMLFLGYNSSFSTSSTFSRGFSGFKNNCIFFTDNLCDYRCVQYEE